MTSCKQLIFLCPSWYLDILFLKEFHHSGDQKPCWAEWIFLLNGCSPGLACIKNKHLGFDGFSSCKNPEKRSHWGHVRCHYCQGRCNSNGFNMRWHCPGSQIDRLDLSIFSKTHFVDTVLGWLNNRDMISLYVGCIFNLYILEVAVIGCAQKKSQLTQTHLFSLKKARCISEALEGWRHEVTLAQGAQGKQPSVLCIDYIATRFSVAESVIFMFQYQRIDR